MDSHSQGQRAREFTVHAWATGSQEEGGEMVPSFLGKYKVTEMSAQQVRSLLGPSTGYYDYDEYPAYLVGPRTAGKAHGDGYLRVFITDKRSSKVRQVILVPAAGDK